MSSRKRTCPTPHKQAHATETQAIAHERSLRANRPTIDERAYRCVCGAWHVGAKKRRKPRRNR